MGLTSTERCREWRRRNPERAKEIRKKSYYKRRAEDQSVILRTNLAHARSRASKKGIPFALTVDDLPPVPEVCPALAIALTRSGGKNSPHLPELDRLVPARGYVPGNVRWISRRANTIKNSADPDEIIKVALWLEVELSNGARE